jgi:hypothetical protein
LQIWKIPSCDENQLPARLAYLFKGRAGGSIDLAMQRKGAVIVGGEGDEEHVL